MHSGFSTPHPSMPCCGPQQACSSQVFVRASSACLVFYLEPPTLKHHLFLLSHQRATATGMSLPLFSLPPEKGFSLAVFSTFLSQSDLRGAEKGKAKCTNKDFSSSGFFLSSFCDATTKLLSQQPLYLFSHNEGQRLIYLDVYSTLQHSLVLYLITCGAILIQLNLIVIFS